jgi:hypothetical protein
MPKVIKRIQSITDLPLQIDSSDPAAIEAAARAAKEPPKLTLQASAADVLTACREMLPTRPIELTGALILRNRKGIVQKECDYRLRMRRGRMETHLSVSLFARHGTNELASVKISRRGNARPTIELISDANSKPVESPLERVMDTDVTWLDLTFDFLWWTDAAYEVEREGETVHGQTCMVILVRPPEKIEGLEAVRLWADKKTGCLMQAEQLGAGLKPLRRLWGTRVKKFDNRWMVSVLEVETLGSRHRTKITVEDLKEL